MKQRPISRTAPRTFVLVVLGLAVLVGEPRGVPVAAAADRKAADLEARKAFTAGEYQKALDIYVDLYAETRHPTYTRNIARCHQNLGHAEQAIAGFREYLRKAKNLTPEQQAEVEKYIAEMEELKKKQVAAAAPPSSTASPVRTDGTVGSAKQGAPGVASGDGARQQGAANPGLPGPTPVPRASKAPGVDLSAQAVPAKEATQGSQAGDSSPFYTRAWFWAGAGAVVAGIVAGVIILRTDRGPLYGNLGQKTFPPAPQ